MFSILQVSGIVLDRSRHLIDFHNSVSVHKSLIICRCTLCRKKERKNIVLDPYILLNNLPLKYTSKNTCYVKFILLLYEYGVKKAFRLQCKEILVSVLVPSTWQIYLAKTCSANKINSPGCEARQVQCLVHRYIFNARTSTGVFFSSFIDLLSPRRVQGDCSIIQCKIKSTNITL